MGAWALANDKNDKHDGIAFGSQAARKGVFTITRTELHMHKWAYATRVESISGCMPCFACDKNITSRLALAVAKPHYRKNNKYLQETRGREVAERSATRKGT